MKRFWVGLSFYDSSGDPFTMYEVGIKYESFTTRYTIGLETFENPCLFVPFRINQIIHEEETTFYVLELEISVSRQAQQKSLILYGRLPVSKESSDLEIWTEKKLVRETARTFGAFLIVNETKEEVHIAGFLRKCTVYWNNPIQTRMNVVFDTCVGMLIPELASLIAEFAQLEICFQ